MIPHGAYFGTHNSRSYHLEVMHPSAALQWQNEKYNFHEVELTRLQVNKNYSAYDVIPQGGGFEGSGSRNKTEIALRYEYMLCFAKKRDRKIVPSLGFGLAPSLIHHSFHPENTTLFRVSETTVLLEGQVIPRLNYHLNSRFYLDMNIPVSAVSFDMTTFRTSNPQIPVRLQKSSNFDFSLVRSFYGVRLGLGFKL